MSFLEDLRRAKAILEDQKRVSARALSRELGLQGAALEELIEELVDVQQVVRRTGQILVWIGEGGAIERQAASHSRLEGDPSSTSEALTANRPPYTPRHLAEKILNSRSALEGERKQVTVLFADVKGSMDLAEQLDAEAWHTILDQFFQILTAGVHRFEGTVNQYTGDGIMALFGAPIAHEDHAQRACYAALYLRDELRRYGDRLRVEQGVNFSVRMGLNSGEVIVGSIGDDLRMDYTAQGHTVGLAARMEQLAEPGKVLLAEPTAQLVTGYCQVRDLGAAHIKGLSGPLHVYELAGMGALRTRLDLSRVRGLSKFVGRNDEMAAIDGALERAVAGDGQVVGLMAEAGIGKSRLCYEFVQRCQARGLAVYQAHAVAHGAAVPLLPVLELLRAYFGITDREPEFTARDKIAGRMLLLDPTLADAVPLMLDFLGVSDPNRPATPLDPDARQRQLIDLMQRLVRARAAREPAVLVIEDLHWLDDASAGFVRHVVDAVAGGRTLLLVNFRPQFHASWMQQPHYQQIPLQPLAADLIDDLLRDFLGVDPSLVGLAQRIRERTGGNPFFIEEVLQSMIQAGVLQGARGAYHLIAAIEEVSIPSTVQAVLAARIDRLAEPEKHLLQTAAVIGKQFSGPVLRRVTEMADADVDRLLPVLVAGEFLYEAALYPDAEYAFKHPLTQEVAYASQLSERRRQIHGRVAEALAAVHADKLDERAAAIARHWAEAGAALAAARWHGRAAEWIERRDLAEALPHWRAVRDLVQAVPQSSETMTLQLTACIHVLDLGWRIGLSVEEADGLLAEGRELATRLDDADALLRLRVAFDTLQFVTGRAPAGSLVEELVDAPARRDAEDPAGQLAQLSQVVAGAVSVGTLHAAMATSEEGLALLRMDPSLEVTRSAFILRGFRILALTYLGQLAQAGSEVDILLQRARQHEQIEMLSFAHGWASFVAQCRGDRQVAIAHAQKCAEIGNQLGSPFSRAVGFWNLSNAQVTDEQWGSAVATCEAGLAIVRERGVGMQFEGIMLVFLAEALLRAGEVERARAVTEEAIVVCHTRGQKLFEFRAHLVQAQLLLEVDGLAARPTIEAALAKADGLCQETGLKNWEPLLYERRAELARLLGDDAGCRDALRTAHRLYLAMGAHAYAERLSAALR